MSTKDHLSNRSVKAYANIISRIKSPGLPETAGEVSVCSHPVSTNCIVTFAGDGSWSEKTLWCGPGYCYSLLNSDIVI